MYFFGHTPHTTIDLCYNFYIMIELTRLDESKIWVNEDLFLTAEETPDTVITFVTGQKLIVQESCEEIRNRIWRFDQKFEN